MLGRVIKYLLSIEPDYVGQLLYDEIYALYAGFFQPRNLLLYDGLKRHVRCKETDSDTCNHSGTKTLESVVSSLVCLTNDHLCDDDGIL